MSDILAKGKSPEQWAAIFAERGCALPVIRGLNRVQAAAYIGVSPSLFDQMVADGRMPKAKAINARTVWDRLAVDRAFDLLPGGDALPEDDDWTAEV